MKCSEFVWVQRNGEAIRVREMDDKHLLNTIRMLRRGAEKMASSLNGNNQPPYYDHDTVPFEFLGEELVERHPTWFALQFERKMRQLEELPWKEEVVA